MSRLSIAASILFLFSLSAVGSANADSTPDEQLLGSWRLVAAQKDGEAVGEEELARRRVRWTFKPNSVLLVGQRKGKMGKTSRTTWKRDGKYLVVKLKRSFRFQFQVEDGQLILKAEGKELVFRRPL